MASAPTGLNAAGTGDHLQRMHLTRPKSAKGRTRTTPQGFPHTVETAYPSCPSPPPRASSVRASPRIGQEDIPELLNQLPPRPLSSSLNRYRVLPSIGTGGADCTVGELVSKTNAMRLATEVRDRPAKPIYRDQTPTASTGRDPGTRQRPVRPEDPPQDPPDQEPRLLLAIRCHSAKRFLEYFRPSDTLHTVVTVAEARMGIHCKDCRVETMEVPRRSFPDLRQTLQECGIPNKSVLCIYQVERD